MLKKLTLRQLYLIPLAYQLFCDNLCWRVKTCGSESSTYGIFVPGSESTWLRKFHISLCHLGVCKSVCSVCIVLWL